MANGWGHWVQFCHGLHLNAKTMTIIAQPHVAPSMCLAVGSLHAFSKPQSALLSRPFSQQKNVHSIYLTCPKPHSCMVAELEFRCGVYVRLGVHNCNRDTTCAWAHTV